MGVIVLVWLMCCLWCLGWPSGRLRGRGERDGGEGTGNDGFRLAAAGGVFGSDSWVGSEVELC